MESQQGAWGAFLRGALITFALIHAPALAEPNPFGGGDVAPTPELREDDDFSAAPGGGIGLPPAGAPGLPPGAIGAPPVAGAPPQKGDTVVAAPPPAAIVPSAPAVPSFQAAPSAASATAAAPPRSSPTTKAGGKPAPRLAEYLELDPSVKGLEVKNFDLPDKDIKDVVTLISKWTGKNFILDNKVRGKITIIGPSQVSLQEAYHAFLSALDANGLTTVQSGKFIRIIESAEARRAPVETFAGDYAPNTDQFITRIFQLKYINADEVQREFRDLTTRQGKLFAYEPTNSIIITDTGSNIRRIEEILQVLDVKGFETSLHVLKINFGSAKAIANMLGEIYGDDRKAGGGGGGGPRTFRRSALDRTRGGGIISKIIPDDATNSLVVLANESGFAQLKQLVGRLDVKVTDTGRIHVYYCEYAKAEDLASTLASLSGGGGGAKSTPRRAPAPGGTGGAPAPSGPTGPVTAELEGGVKITSDSATNALVITANASDYQTLKRVIRKLDIPRLQVFVETAIIEVALDTSTKVGVNAAIGTSRGLAGGFIGDTDGLLAAVRGGAVEGASIPFFIGKSFQASIPGPSSTNLTVPLSTFMGMVSFLTKNTNSSVLSTPQIIALDNEKAEFKVQDEIPVQTTFTANLGAAAGVGGAGQGTIERLKTGIDIKLTPHVNAASRTIRLEIEQKVDSTKANTNVPAALAQVQVATTSRMTNTSVVVRDGDFVMLGGLMSDKIDDSVSKVPLLGDIPILGWLFKSKQFRAVKTNLIILLHPRIIGTSLDSARQIRKSLNKRQRFIDRNMGGDDEFESDVKELRKSLRDQENRAKDEPQFDYRNNLGDDGRKVYPRQESQLDGPVDERSATGDLPPAPMPPIPGQGVPPVPPPQDFAPIPAEPITGG